MNPINTFKNWLGEFRDFAFKGNMIDLAVAVVLGQAFGNVIASIVKNVVMGLVGYVHPGNANAPAPWENWHVGQIKFGLVIGDLLNFVIVAAAIFIVLVKPVSMAMKYAKRKQAAAPPTTKPCPYCLSEIPIKAVKCAHCTSDLKPAI